METFKKISFSHKLKCFNQKPDERQRHLRHHSINFYFTRNSVRSVGFGVLWKVSSGDQKISRIEELKSTADYEKEKRKEMKILSLQYSIHDKRAPGIVWDLIIIIETFEHIFECFITLLQSAVKTLPN